jgi:hypothetical protein
MNVFPDESPRVEHLHLTEEASVNVELAPHCSGAF